MGRAWFARCWRSRLWVLLITVLLLVRGQCTTCRSVSEKKACLIVLVLVPTIRCIGPYGPAAALPLSVSKCMHAPLALGPLM